VTSDPFFNCTILTLTLTLSFLYRTVPVPYTGQTHSPENQEKERSRDAVGIMRFDQKSTSNPINLYLCISHHSRLLVKSTFLAKRPNKVTLKYSKMIVLFETPAGYSLFKVRRTRLTYRFVSSIKNEST
jgi:hypothetical protein